MKDTTRLQHLFKIVDTALTLSPEQQMPYLTQVCNDDEVLLVDSEQLLKSIHESEAFWDEWTKWYDDQLFQILRASENDLSGQDQIGSWRLIKLLGQGGMGNVYLAERADGQYEQRAAVKVLRQGFEYGDTRRSFEQERQILARLDHPNIALLYDGGVLDDGRPWLAMQYVAGTRITDWAQQQNLPLSGKLDLFLQVCDAVRYAHKNLIVHRDLKPDNVLVTKQGTVKILDFGIAKLIDETSSGKSQDQGGSYLRAMSIDYAAPEQINGKIITTATDVYALGIMLYEVLTGIYPFELNGKVPLQKDELHSLRNSPGHSSRTSPKRPELPRDLDAIALKAMSEDPAPRYENAGQLADDIVRYRSGLPVAARKNIFSYRFSKFYQRNRGKITAALGVVVLITALVVYYTIQVTNQRNEAQLQAKKAEQVVEFLTGLFEASDPRNALGENITANELLEKGSARIDKNLKDDPEVKATMLKVLGTVYQNLGIYEKSRSHFEEALRLRRDIPDISQTDIVKNLNNLATTLLYLGMTEKARGYLNEALEIEQKAGKPDYPELASTLNNLGFIHLRNRELDSAEAELRQAINLRRKHVSQDPFKLATNLDGLAITLERKGNTEEAENFYSEALDIRQKTLAANHPDVARSLNNLAGFLARQGEPDKAVPLYRKALNIWQQVYEGDHPDVSKALNNLGSMLEKQGRLDTAEILYRQSLEMKRNLLGDHHISVAVGLNNLGLLLQKKKDYKAAEPLLKESLNIRLNVYHDQPHPQTARGYHSLATLYEDMGNYTEAAKWYRKELSMLQGIQPPDHQHIARAKLSLGNCLMHLSHFEEAEPLLLDAYSGFSDLEDQNPKDLYKNLASLSELYASWEKPEQASRYDSLLHDKVPE